VRRRHARNGADLEQRVGAPASFSSPHDHRPTPPRLPVQDDCERIQALPALIATRSPPFSLTLLLIFNLWTTMINSTVRHQYAPRIQSVRLSISPALVPSRDLVFKLPSLVEEGSYQSPVCFFSPPLSSVCVLISLSLLSTCVRETATPLSTHSGSGCQVVLGCAKLDGRRTHCLHFHQAQFSRAYCSADTIVNNQS
jgi:hypothetical protein